MEFEIWHYWILASIVFFLLEIFVPSFIMASIGIGCIAALLGAAISAPFPVQLVLFIVGTIAGFVSVKPFMKKYAYNKKVLQTNASGLIGRTGKVKEEINEKLGTGAVAIDGDLWSSVPAKNEIIKVGEKVKVVNLSSIILTVEPLEEKNQQKQAETEIQEKKETERLTLKIGNRIFFIVYNEIAFLYSSEKITHIVNYEGKQYIHDMSLENLNAILPGEMFFRANRQFIVTRSVISEIKPAPNGKLKVNLNVSNGFPNRISVSRLKAAAFRKWLDNS